MYAADVILAINIWHLIKYNILILLQYVASLIQTAYCLLIISMCKSDKSPLP